MQTENTPYAEALQLIQEHSTTESAAGLAKLILFLWNDDCGYSYRECIRAFDGNRNDLAVRIIKHFHKVGEDQELRKIGRKSVRPLSATLGFVPSGV